jgi:hypothetical protein
MISKLSIDILSNIYYFLNKTEKTILNIAIRKTYGIQKMYVKDIIINKELLNWALVMKCPKKYISRYIAQLGDVDMLKYAQKKNCCINSYTAAEAAKYGNLNILEYLDSKYNKIIDEYTLYGGSLACNLPVIKFVFEKIKYNKNKIYSTALNKCCSSSNSLNFDECFKYLFDKCYSSISIYNVKLIINALIRSNNLEMFKYIESKQYRFLESELITACEFGSISIVKYLVEQRGMNVYSYLNDAYLSGNIELVTYIEKKIIDSGNNITRFINNSTMKSAINSGNLELVKRLNNNINPLNNPKIYLYAAKYLDIIKYLTNIAPDNLSDIIRLNDLCTIAAKSNVDVLKFLINIGCKYDKFTIIQSALHISPDSIIFFIEHHLDQVIEVVNEIYYNMIMYDLYYNFNLVMTSTNVIGIEIIKLVLRQSNLIILRHIYRYTKDKSNIWTEDVFNYALGCSDITIIKYLRKKCIHSESSFLFKPNYLKTVLELGIFNDIDEFELYKSRVSVE